MKASIRKVRKEEEREVCLKRYKCKTAVRNGKYRFSSLSYLETSNSGDGVEGLEWEFPFCLSSRVKVRKRNFNEEKEREKYKENLSHSSRQGTHCFFSLPLIEFRRYF
ncbi:hypothetical protein CEXT_235881 [Caerostris extrusa]|uniref:Uncharacterized protein n=1 Tax=Caerostris extrusa TaxID=172846 RepID=A0AAV4N5J7_CAEEX|nr:hypothetical protein CEXT_235881 [Caerostris extrusa]